MRSVSDFRNFVTEFTLVRVTNGSVQVTLVIAPESGTSAKVVLSN